MKKLMIAAAAAAMVSGVYADPCDDEVAYDSCIAYDLKLKVKTLGPKKLTCKVVATDASVCDDEETVKEKVYFLDNVTRSFKGYAWTCDYACGGEFNVVLWDAKNNGAALAIGDTDTLDLFGANIFRYAKKANKVAVATDLATETAELKLAGLNGSFKAAKDSEYNYVKSISGNCAGVIKVVQPSDVKTAGYYEAGNICEDGVYTDCSDEEVFDILTVGICDCFDSYCDDDSVTPDADMMVPASGTWSMKYNKSVSAGKKGTIKSLCPAYAW